MNNIDFPVVEKQLQTEDGLKVDAKGIIRTDKNICLGVMGIDYKLVPHKDVVENMEKYLPTRLNNRYLYTCKQGAVMFGLYETPEIQDIEVANNDIIKFGLEIFNSYNGLLQVGFILRAKIVRNNSMLYIPKSIANISMKHSGNLDVSQIRNEFQKRLPLFMQTALKWKEWENKLASYVMVEDYLNKNLPERMAKILYMNFLTTKNKTVWELYLLLCEYATHNIKTHKDNTDNKRLAQFTFEKKVLSNFYFMEW